MNERDGERLLDAVGEYLLALDNLDRLRRTIQVRVSVSDGVVAECWDAARVTRLALAELRKSHAKCAADVSAPRRRRPARSPKHMGVWPVGRGQDV